MNIFDFNSELKSEKVKQWPLFPTPTLDFDSDPWINSTPTSTPRLEKKQLLLSTPTPTSEHFRLQLRKWTYLNPTPTSKLGKLRLLSTPTPDSDSDSELHTYMIRKHVIDTLRLSFQLMFGSDDFFTHYLFLSLTKKCFLPQYKNL